MLIKISHHQSIEVNLEWYYEEESNTHYLHCKDNGYNVMWIQQTRKSPYPDGLYYPEGPSALFGIDINRYFLIKDLEVAKKEAEKILEMCLEERISSLFINKVIDHPR